ncbi:hypothetical protein L325_13175, partial [Yersinia pestis 9]
SKTGNYTILFTVSSLVRQMKMLGAHLDALAKDAAAFNLHLNSQHKNTDNFSGDNT